MKLLAALILTFACFSQAHASGKLTIKPMYVIEGDDVKTQYVLGLPVYEKIFSKLAYKGWVGAGTFFEEDYSDRRWVKIEQGLETYVGPFSFGFGGALQHIEKSSTLRKTIYTTLSVTLWD